MSIKVSAEDAKKLLSVLEDMDGDYSKLKSQLAERAYPMRIVNLTPHDINILDENDNVVNVLPGAGRSGSVRATVVRKNSMQICGVPVCDRICTELCNLPAPQKNTYYVVSQMAARYVTERRDDLLTIDTQVRDEFDRVIGCRGLIRVHTDI